jgi:hypothetical protein
MSTDLLTTLGADATALGKRPAVGPTVGPTVVEAVADGRSCCIRVARLEPGQRES